MKEEASSKKVGGGSKTPYGNPKEIEVSPEELMKVVEDNAVEMELTKSDTPKFAPASDKGKSTVEFRRIQVPAHRYTPLKDNWMKIYKPLVEHMHLSVRMNLKNRSVELKTTPETQELGSIQKGADFVRAFVLGFEVKDAVALLRLDDLYIQTFEVQDVKMLKGDHMSRAIGRIAGKGGKTKFTIENSTTTRIVVADKKIHILGSFSNIKLARDAICALILGSPPGKVYAKLRSVVSRLKEKF
mmetsp:Transcript_27386/g.70391  ORF Transcript_27386/g.70391 Transcript_27386/m.70391 type:complete len:243 (-) Transcript_27386:478-1206(-)